MREVVVMARAWEATKWMHARPRLEPLLRFERPTISTFLWTARPTWVAQLTPTA